VGLGDEAVHTVENVGGGRNIVDGSAGVGRRGIGGRPWTPLQQCGDNGIDADLLCRQRTLRLGNVIGRRDASRAVQTSGLALAFVVAEEKGLVFDNRSAQRAAELVVVEGGFGSGGGVEEVARVHGVVAQIIRRRPVQFVGSGLR